MSVSTIAIGVMTHNAFSFGRTDLLKRTIDSVMTVFAGADVFVVDNGSWDGTPDVVAEVCTRPGVAILSSWDGEGSYGPGRGRNFLQSHFMSTGADVFVCSDDDIVWREGAAEAMIDFWSDAPNDVAIMSGLLEPEWSWNTPRGVVKAGGRRALVRDSAPGAAWSYRRRDVSAIFPLAEVMRPDLGEDYAACLRLRGAGWRVAQMDLAEHIGDGRSTHGNKASSWAKPLDRKRWGI